MNRTKIRKTALLAVIVALVLLTGAAGHRAASERSGPMFKSRELIMLEEAKSAMEREGREIPEELERKIARETRYSLEMAEEMEKRKRDIRLVEEMRNLAPKDGKGSLVELFRPLLHSFRCGIEILKFG